MHAVSQNIVDSLRDPLLILGDDMRVITASRPLLRLVGVPTDRPSATSFMTCPGTKAFERQKPFQRDRDPTSSAAS